MKVSVVIPAYNEEKTVSDIVTAARSIPYIHEVIVVSDGSEDATVQVAQRAGARVIQLMQNIGKGGAMMVGVSHVQDADVILFLDADLLGLTPNHIEELLLPILNDEADMTIGIFESGRMATDLAQVIAPYLSGQRAIRRDILTQISNLDITRFGVEIALTRHFKAAGLRVKEVVLKDMSHLMKEEKFGVVKGFVARMKMYWEIAKCVGKI